MTTKEFNLRMSFDVINLSIHIIRKRILTRTIANILKKSEKIKKFVTKNIKDVQKKQMNNANMHRKNIKYEVKNLS